MRLIRWNNKNDVCCHARWIHPQAAPRQRVRRRSGQKSVSEGAIQNMSVKLSALDLVTAFPGQTAKEAIDRAVEVANGVEKLGWERYLIAEHHNMASVVSSSTALVVQRVLAGTEKIQVGSGGVMLSNHSPLQVAETYGTLDALYPGRVDLGIGRAPGTDPATASLIVRKDYMDANEFASDVALILHFFDAPEKQKHIAAYPGVGADVHPIILGSSLSSAHVAAALGLPYAFAAHINPRSVEQASQIYRAGFRPSRYLQKPYLIVSVWLYAGKTTEQAEEMFEHGGKLFLTEIHGRKDPEAPLTSAEKILLTQTMGTTFHGGPEEIAAQWKQLDAAVHPDELMTASASPEAAAILESYQIVDSVVRG